MPWVVEYYVHLAKNHVLLLAPTCSVASLILDAGTQPTPSPLIREQQGTKMDLSFCDVKEKMFQIEKISLDFAD